jgi:hypothetical protein
MKERGKKRRKGNKIKARKSEEKAGMEQKDWYQERNRFHALAPKRFQRGSGG